MSNEYLSLVDYWETDNQLVTISENLNEQESNINGNGVLCKVLTHMFVPDGNSQNKRHYPKKLWENALKSPNVKSKLSDKLMFGRIGHENRPVSEEDLNNGVVSHVVSKLWIDEKNRGMGEVLVLDTPAGRNLNTYFRAGSRLKPSSRASGKFLERKNEKNYPIVDPNSYILETFDFVLRPGFKEVSIDVIKEEETLSNNSSDEDYSLKENSNTEDLTNLKGVRNMSNDRLDESIVLEMREEKNQLKEENTRLNERISDLENSQRDIIDRAKDLERELEQKIEENFELSSELATYDFLKESRTDVESVKEFVESLQLYGFRNLDSFKDFFENLNTNDIETLKSLNVSISDVIHEWNQYREFGDLNEIDSISEGAANVLKEYEEKIGRPEEIDEIVEILENTVQYVKEMKDLGDPAEIEDTIERAGEILEEYAELGTPAEIESILIEAAEILENYQQLGTVDELQEVIERYLGMRNEVENLKLSEEVEQLATDYNVDVNLAIELLEKLDYNDAVRFLEKVENKQTTYAGHALTLNESRSSVSLNEGRSSTGAGTFFNSALKSK